MSSSHDLIDRSLAAVGLPTDGTHDDKIQRLKKAENQRKIKNDLAKSKKRKISSVPGEGTKLSRLDFFNKHASKITGSKSAKRKKLDMMYNEYINGKPKSVKDVKASQDAVLILTGFLSWLPTSMQHQILAHYRVCTYDDLVRMYLSIPYDAKDLKQSTPSKPSTSASKPSTSGTSTVTITSDDEDEDDDKEDEEDADDDDEEDDEEDDDDEDDDDEDEDDEEEEEEDEEDDDDE